MEMNRFEAVGLRGVTPKEFSELYPRLYHMAHEDAWEQIQRYGLLSTTSILTLWEVKGEQRSNIESEVRRTSVELAHARHGKIVIRDQKPMYEKKLRKALVDCTPQEWCQLFNRKVFLADCGTSSQTHFST
jgi:hypothetical protein